MIEINNLSKDQLQEVLTSYYKILNQKIRDYDELYCEDNRKDWLVMKSKYQSQIQVLNSLIESKYNVLNENSI